MLFTPKNSYLMFLFYFPHCLISHRLCINTLKAQPKLLLRTVNIKPPHHEAHDIDEETNPEITSGSNWSSTKGHNIFHAVDWGAGWRSNLRMTLEDELQVRNQSWAWTDHLPPPSLLSPLTHSRQTHRWEHQESDNRWQILIIVSHLFLLVVQAEAPSCPVSLWQITISVKITHSQTHHQHSYRWRLPMGNSEPWTRRFFFFFNKESCCHQVVKMIYDSLDNKK